MFNRLVQEMFRTSVGSAGKDELQFLLASNECGMLMAKDLQNWCLR
jgi:hypothetical protein